MYMCSKVTFQGHTIPPDGGDSLGHCIFILRYQPTGEGGRGEGEEEERREREEGEGEREEYK